MDLKHWIQNRHHQVLFIAFDNRFKTFRRCLNVFMNNNLAHLIENANIHLFSVQIDPAIKMDCSPLQVSRFI
jgi:hypothetical protein